MNRFSIKSRLIALAAGVLILLALTSAAGILRLREANQLMKSMYSDRVVALGALKAVKDAYGAGVGGSAHKVHDGQIDAPEAIRRIVEAQADIAKQWSTYRSTTPTEQERALIGQAEPLMDRANVATSHLVELLRANDTEGVRTFVASDIGAVLDPLAPKLAGLTQLQIDVAAKTYAQSQAEYRATLWLAVLGAVLVFVVVAGTCWVLILSIVRPLERAVEFVARVASGDLSSRLEVAGEDEFTRLLADLSRMADRLQRTVGEVRRGSEAVMTASKEIAAGNSDLSSRTEKQASSLEETAASMEELISTVKQNAEHAQQASQLAITASQVAGKGGAVVSQVVDTMDSINASSRKIVDIISVIDGIAFQTNILALNAAVEAARAGEQGRGFAVVAAEVRALAQRSGAAAKEIKALIDESVTTVGQGGALVGQAGATMNEIVASVKRVTDIIGEISAATHEQTAGIEQVNQAISQIETVTQQNAALVEEASAAAQSMENQASELGRSVSAFRLARAA
jgi:methyl-accepting chemotaxis protein